MKGSITPGYTEKLIILNLLYYRLAKQLVFK